MKTNRLLLAALATGFLATLQFLSAADAPAAPDAAKKVPNRSLPSKSACSKPGLTKVRSKPPPHRTVDGPLIKAPGPEWTGPQPHTLLVAPGGKIVFHHTGILAEADLLAEVIKVLTPFYQPAP